MPHTLVEGFTGRIRDTLKLNNAAVDLTGMSVDLLAFSQGTEITLAGTSGIETPGSGLVYFDPDPTDLVYSRNPLQVRWKVTDQNNKVVFFPSGPADVWVIQKWSQGSQPSGTGTIDPNNTNTLVEILPSGVDAQVVKVHTGALNVDGGPVTTGNPLPVTSVNQATLETLISTLNSLVTSFSSGVLAKIPDQVGGATPVTGPLTDTQLRNSAVGVTGPLTDTQLRNSAVPVSGPLTDTQLRASSVTVDGPLTDTQLRAANVPVSGPLTDTQLRDSPVPVLASSSDTILSQSLTALNQVITSLAGRLDIRVVDDEGLYLLRRIVKICECLMVVDSNQRQRVTVDALPTLGTVTTVSTLTTLNGLQSLDPRYMMSDIARSAYATAIRQNLVVS